MVLELDTSLFDKFNISINQAVFLTLVMNENQHNNQDIHQFLSRISEDDIQELVSNGTITVNTSGDSQVYSLSESSKELLKEEKTWFDEFYEVFPVYVMRPDGTKGFLRSNINKCRKEYNRTVGKSKAMHEHIMNCLRKEIDDKIMTGKLGYMKTMWKWITQHEWEAIEEQMYNEPVTSDAYGTSCI